MAFDAHKNFAASTVAAPPSPATSGLTLTAKAGEGVRFPAAPFNATIWPPTGPPSDANAEIVRVTNVSGDTFTFLRTQENTNGRAIGVGDQIVAGITAKTITDIESSLQVPLPDNAPMFANFVDPTKRATFDLSNLTTGVTRTYIFPDQDGTFLMGGPNTVTNLMLAGSITSNKFVGTDIAVLGTITTGTWHGTPITNSFLATPTVTVTAGAGLVGGGTTTLGGTLTLGVAAGGITNAMLVNSSLAVLSGSGLSGGGVVPLGGITTLSIGAAAITNAMLAGSIAAFNLVGTDITTVGTLTTGTWQATPIANAFLQNASLTVGSGSGLSGGGLVSLGGSLTLSIGAGAITNTMLAGGIASAKLIGTDIAIVGTITTGTWQGTAIGNAFLANPNVTVTAGAGLSGGGLVSLGGTVTFTNAGVTSITGTANQIVASNPSGSVLLSLSPTMVAPGTLTVTSHFTVEGVTSTGATGTGKIVFDGSPTLGSPTTTGLLTIGGSVQLTSFGAGVATVDGIGNLSSTARLGYTALVQATGGGILLGRGTSGSGDWQEITLGSNLSFTGTVLSATGGGGGGTVTNTGTLTSNRLVVGNGGIDITTLGSVGTSTQVLHGNVAGLPTFGAVNLASDITGALPYANLVPASAASVLVGRGSAGGAGFFQEITLGTGLVMTGTVLSSSSSGGSVTHTAGPLTVDQVVIGNAASDIKVMAAGTSGTVLAGVTGAAPTFRALTESDITNLTSDLNALSASITANDSAAEHVANKNVAGGYAGLDGSSKLTGSQQVYGTVANTAAQGNDIRLSDARTPTAHATTHSSGGSDPVTVTNLAGFPGGTTTFLRADGTFAATPGTGTVTHTAGALTASAVVVGNGVDDVKVLASLGTTTTVLHGNAAGLPTYGAVSLTADVSGRLPFANLVAATAISVLAGRGAAAGTGDFQEVTLGTGLVMTGTVLSTSIAASALTGTTLAASIVTSSLTSLGTLAADLLFTDATFDIGKSGATRPRDGFFSRNVAVGGTLTVTGVASFPATTIGLRGVTYTLPAADGTLNQVLTTSGGAVLSWATPTSVIPNPIAQDLLFTDATYDIGKTGATRPRDGFFSRNLAVGGTLIATGAVTHSSTTSFGGNIISDLLFTDATFDIGKSGATRPRDGFFSRNVTIGGTLLVTGIATHSAAIDISAAGAGQIIFPTTQNASAGSRTLDDYGEGAWTPTDASGAALTLTVGTSHYIKVGQLVVAWFDILYPVTADTSTSKIGSIPFTGLTSNAFGGFMTSTNYSATVNEVTFFGSTTTFSFRDTTGSAITNVSLSGKTVRGTLIYRASA